MPGIARSEPREDRSVKDSFGREVTNIRISVTDRCNLKCFYCMPGGVGDFAPKPEVITLDETLRIAEATASLGIRNYRITGGEPLVRPGLVEFLARLKRVPGVESLSITTNALLLDEKIDDLLEAGVEGVNLSLDTFRRERFAEITGYRAPSWPAMVREMADDPTPYEAILSRQSSGDDGTAV